MPKKSIGKKRKLILKNYQCPGDNIMLSHALKSLHETYPGRFITDVRVTCRDIFEGNPFITILREEDFDVRVINCEYPTIDQSNQSPVQFITSFTTDLSNKLKLPIWPTEFQGVIYIRDEEKGWFSQVREILNEDVPYWCIAASHKSDFTAKAWAFDRYQEVVDRFPDVWFVQVGEASPGHIHANLKGKNLINLVGKTNIRQMIRLVYNSFGTISPVTFLHHLAVAVPPHPRFNRKSRASIVISGGREPVTWQQASNQQFLHTCGMLDCCDHGGCWKSRVVALGDGDSKDDELCIYPIQLGTGQWVSKCMNMITTDDVSRLIEKYMSNLTY
jgi:ADP-heptose:LPS heptosyltransferase